MKLIVMRPHFNARDEVVLERGAIVDSDDPRVDRNRCAIYNEAKTKRKLAERKERTAKRLKATEAFRAAEKKAVKEAFDQAEHAKRVRQERLAKLTESPKKAPGKAVDLAKPEPLDVPAKKG